MKYTGTLSKPVVKGRRGLINAPDFTADRERIFTEINAKLPELFKIHGVSEGDWKDLALALAGAHVPGFKVVERAGRKREWDYLKKVEFRIAVDDLISKSKNALPVTEAIRRAKRLDRWKVKIENMKIPALSQHYYAVTLEDVDYWKERLPMKQLSKTNNS